MNSLFNGFVVGNHSRDCTNMNNFINNYNGNRSNVNNTHRDISASAA